MVLEYLLLLDCKLCLHSLWLFPFECTSPLFLTLTISQSLTRPSPIFLIFPPSSVSGCQARGTGVLEGSLELEAQHVSKHMRISFEKIGNWNRMKGHPDMKTLETCCRKFLVPLEAFGRQRFKDSKRPLKCPAKVPKGQKVYRKSLCSFPEPAWAWGQECKLRDVHRRIEVSYGFRWVQMGSDCTTESAENNKKQEQIETWRERDKLKQSTKQTNITMAKEHRGLSDPSR